ncbi:D-glycero-alpha-D-manno-heptose-1,7-bisphosphate 7-phosphatase [Roseateles sp. NT4]|uniref:D-glycero-alpha-D-manno-heptose-1,7-bisphosphate 7-phosphatase n=1 Tax=Roseateles sp. NT4 TaxID=3453715 RepID=UPI003EEF0B3C
MPFMSHDPFSLLSMHDLPQRSVVRPPQRPALFLDMDGSLVENLSHDTDPLQLRFMPGVGEALARLQAAGLALVVVTNQSGLAHGRFTRAEFARLQQVLLQRLLHDHAVRVDGVEVCPHAPDSEGRPACLCRMPAPGMLIRAAHRHGLDLKRSWMVGNTLDDVEAGHRAGAGGLLLDSGAETAWRRSPLREPDARFFDWPNLATYVGKLAGSPAAVPAEWLPRPQASYTAAVPAA